MIDSPEKTVSIPIGNRSGLFVSRKPLLFYTEISKWEHALIVSIEPPVHNEAINCCGRLQSVYLSNMEKVYPAFQDILEFSQNDICSFLMKKLKCHHRDTYLHSIRVSSLCAELFDLFGILKEEQETMIRSALLHDIGKIRIDASLLSKQGFLDKEEWKTMKNHCRNGFDILDTDRMKKYINPEIILYHHENLDGTGYYGLMNNELTVGVKIIRVADSFDAMTQPRAYSKAKSTAEAFEELYRWSGVQYDPLVVDAIYTLKYHK